jgi:tetratricopeptide (TPR) repeat protein
MKWHLWRVFMPALVLSSAAACATTGGGTVPPIKQAPQTALPDNVFEGNGLSLGEVIEQSAEKIAADLPAGSRVAIVAWESPSLGLSDYIMEELTGALVDRDMEVADRQNLEYVHRELNFQMSGEVSEESARSIGKFLGADLVITGQLTELGGPYRYRANEDCNSALRLDPNHVLAYTNRGNAYYFKGNYDRAIEDYTAALRINPNYANARHNLEVARRARGY